LVRETLFLRTQPSIPTASGRWQRRTSWHSREMHGTRQRPEPRTGRTLEPLSPLQPCSDSRRNATFQTESSLPGRPRAFPAAALCAGPYVEALSWNPVSNRIRPSNTRRCFAEISANGVGILRTSSRKRGAGWRNLGGGHDIGETCGSDNSSAGAVVRSLLYDVARILRLEMEALNCGGHDEKTQSATHPLPD
jgi:hypothetical protein